MKIPVLGMDPSMRSWGLASGILDLDTGQLTNVITRLVQPKEETSKQVRKNSKDLEVVKQLHQGLYPHVRAAKAIFVEVPIGSQSARAMASYGMCVGILGSLVARGYQLIEVTPTEVKVALAKDRNATKGDMIDVATRLYPNAGWPIYQGKVQAKAEHMADAIGAIHAGVRTPVFQNLMNLLKATHA